MFIVSAVLVTIAGLVSGGVVGAVFGFSLASHSDVMAGVRLSTTNRFIHWIARPSRELSSSETILAFLLILAWLFLFVVLCAIPVVVAVKLDGEGSPLAAFGLAVFVIAGYLGRYVGRRLWLRLL